MGKGTQVQAESLGGNASGALAGDPRGPSWALAHKEWLRGAQGSRERV